MRVFLAPGHGGHDPGAIGPGGLKESATALHIAQRLRRILEAAGHTVGLSRDSEAVYVSPTGQARAADAWGADVSIAIHLNAAGSATARGFEVWTTKGATKSDGLATQIIDAHMRILPAEPVRVDMVDGDPDKESNWSAIMCKAPAVLVECGFLSHPETEARFRRVEHVDTIARVIASGLTAWTLTQ